MNTLGREGPWSALTVCSVGDMKYASPTVSFEERPTLATGVPSVSKRSKPTIMRQASGRICHSICDAAHGDVAFTADSSQGMIQLNPGEAYAPVAATLRSDRTGRTMHLPK